ncbi:hypothetical protein [Methylocystis echinoides]|uniref:Uncharacterized protein n=1 Tax=Methylocystis echinoides TaxID=29468 RepID=A0A9W6LTA6_9HYPH|nr:hypothetical protein [Methylocystis echinoides]GLI94296.1 hypothetical protein LMG27198_32880 [Methylocystis echinoides]
MKLALIDSPFWTLAQAIDWIVHRDADKVAAGADIGSGPASEEANAALWQKLLAGTVRANGRRNGERREIQAIEWLDLSAGSASAKPFLHRFFPGKGTVALARIVATQGDVTTAGNEARRETITYSDVRVARDDVLREWPARSHAGMAAKRGRPQKIDWQGVVYPEVNRLMDHHGEFVPYDPDWYAQISLESKVREFLVRMVGEEATPVTSTIRDHVAKALKLWRDKKAGK